MRVVIQRVQEASVSINQEIHSSIGNGMLIFLGVETEDDLSDVEWLCSKISQLRIFNDLNNIMNLSINEVRGEVLVVSQFTLHASTKKGNRPSFILAARPEKALPLYHSFIQTLELKLGKRIYTGEFGADMKVSLMNNGPFTIIIDSKSKS
jgi:D-tyrosyl-tRNA(Tyr) deacylase